MIKIVAVSIAVSTLISDSKREALSISRGLKTMQDKNPIKERIRCLFQAQKFAVLSTEDKGQPYCSLVAEGMIDTQQAARIRNSRIVNRN